VLTLIGCIEGRRWGLEFWHLELRALSLELNRGRFGGIETALT